MKKNTRRLLTLALPFAVAVFASTAHAAQPERDDSQTVEFTAEAHRAAANDLAVADLYAEQSGANLATISQQVNHSIAAALETARAYGDIKVQSAGTSTSPVYSKDGGKLESWRIRTQLRLETQNIAAMSELLGKLQTTLAVSQISMQPAADTRRQAVDGATVDAIRAFEQRATLIASALNKHYRIRHLNIAESGFRPVQVLRAPMKAEFSASAAPTPLESGESTVGVTLSGRIELID